MKARKKILIVDDEALIVENIQEFLEDEAFECNSAKNGYEALERLAQVQFDIILLDIRMPALNGIATLKKIIQQRHRPEVIMVTAISDVKAIVHCLKNGAFGYLTKPVDLDLMLQEIKRALEHKALIENVRQYKKTLETQVEHQKTEIKTLHLKLKQNFYQSIQLFMDIIGLYDPFLMNHSKRVALLAKRIGLKLGLASSRLIDLEIACLIHDVGRLSLNPQILNKSLKDLNETELKLVENQTLIVEQLLAPMDNLKNVSKIIKHHLERMDGQGFPDRLKDKEILLESRILFVCHDMDEMIYRHHHENQNNINTHNIEQVLKKQIESQVNKKYDAEVVKALIAVLEQYKLKAIGASIIDLHDLQAGMRVAEDIVSETGTILFSKGLSLSSIQIFKLWVYHKTMGAVKKKIYVYNEG